MSEPSRRRTLGARDMPGLPSSRALSVVGGANIFIGILLVVQMWLLSASLEAFLAGHDEVALPGAVVSGLLFLACLMLGRFIDRAGRSSSSS